MSVRIEIPGTPVAKERARRGAAGHWYTPKRTREYEELVATYCLGRRRWPSSSPVAATIVLHFRGAPRADIDNYAKAILDGIVKGGLIDDDRLVRRLNLQFVINPSDEEKAVVELEELAEPEDELPS